MHLSGCYALKKVCAETSWGKNLKRDETGEGQKHWYAKTPLSNAKTLKNSPQKHSQEQETPDVSHTGKRMAQTISGEKIEVH